MAKKKVCKHCKFFYEGDVCPVCKSNQTSTSWQGRIAFVDVSKSDIAKKMCVKQAGEYALKVR